MCKCIYVAITLVIVLLVAAGCSDANDNAAQEQATLVATPAAPQPVAVNPAQQPTEPAQLPVAVEAEAVKNKVFVIHTPPQEEPLLEPERRLLEAGDSITVDAIGRALLYFSNLLLLEVVRDGKVVVREVPLEGQPLLVIVVLSLGTILNNDSPQDHWQEWVEQNGQQVTLVVESALSTTNVSVSPPTIATSETVQGGAITSAGEAAETPAGAMVVTSTAASTATLTPTAAPLPAAPEAAATGTVTMPASQANGWVISQETFTPLLWGMVHSEGVALEMNSGAAQTTVSQGTAYWIAPDGVIGPSVPFKQDAVADWMVKVQSGETAKELGDVVWDQADLVVDFGGLGTLPPPGQPFMYAGVELTMDPTGLNGTPAYTLDDCNGDGLTDIVMRNGKLQLNFRPLLNRVRAADLEMYGATGYRAATSMNPAREVIEQQEEALREGLYELLSLRSDLRLFEQPYHFVELGAENGCFVGFSLTPPEPDDVPGKPRWPVLPETMRPSLTVATPAPRCVVECPAGWGMYRVGAGDTLWAIVERTRYFAPDLTIDEVKQVNCIPADSDIVQLDSLICVPAPPELPPSPVAPPTVETACTNTDLTVTAEYIYTGTVESSVLGAAAQVDTGERYTPTSEIGRLRWQIEGGCPKYLIEVISEIPNDELDQTKSILTQTVDSQGTYEAEIAHICGTQLHVTVTDTSGQKASRAVEIVCALPETPTPPPTSTSEPIN